MKGKKIVMTPPNIQAQLTGAWKAEQEKGNITLTYLDGATESRLSDTPLEAFTSWFAVVSFVQGGRV